MFWNDSPLASAILVLVTKEIIYIHIYMGHVPKAFRSGQCLVLLLQESYLRSQIPEESNLKPKMSGPRFMVPFFKNRYHITKKYSRDFGARFLHFWVRVLKLLPFNICDFGAYCLRFLHMVWSYSPLVSAILVITGCVFCTCFGTTRL